MVFQDPFASLNPRMTVGAAIAEAAGAGNRISRGVRAKEVEDLLELVHLDPAVVRDLPVVFPAASGSVWHWRVRSRFVPRC